MDEAVVGQVDQQHLAGEVLVLLQGHRGGQGWVPRTVLSAVINAESKFGMKLAKGARRRFGHGRAQPRRRRRAAAAMRLVQGIRARILVHSHTHPLSYGTSSFPAQAALDAGTSTVPPPPPLPAAMHNHKFYSPRDLIPPSKHPMNIIHPQGASQTSSSLNVMVRWGCVRCRHSKLLHTAVDMTSSSSSSSS